MKPDFLRHIVNPVIDSYIKPGKLALKDAIEAKKLVFAAEERYKFSVYDGDPANLVTYFKSEEFKAFANLLESCNAKEALMEILEEVKRSYSDIRELVDTVEQVAELLERGPLKHVSSPGTSNVLDLNLEKVASALKDRLNAEVLATPNSVYARLGNVLELEVYIFKHHVKLIFKVNKRTGKHVLEALFGKVLSLAEEVGSI
ncbi:MAG: hypothetical protein QXH02_06930 [Desulfurococcaceae archaeon]